MNRQTNQLIALLPPKVQTRVLDACRLVGLTLSSVLEVSGQPSGYAYFPVSGFISLLAVSADNPRIEVGMIGREGMLGIHIALGVTTAPTGATVQGQGYAWRIETAILQKELEKNKKLCRVLQRYAYVRMAQMVTSSICLRFHHIEPRLARWLLMSHDRACADTFHVTQEFLAYMLGVRRVGITAAALALQTAGLIHYHRGEMTVVNRTGLELAACSCYLCDQQLYADQFTDCSADVLTPAP